MRGSLDRRRGEVSRLLANTASPGFPAPLLTLSEPSVPEGKMVTITCAAEARALVTLDGVPAAVPGRPVQLQLNTTENDDRRGFFCDATLEVDGETLNKNESAELRVLCELTSCLPPRDLQGPTRSLAMSWKWGFSHGTRVASLHFTPLPADAPRLDDSDCPRSWTWPEGPEQTLRCDARGNPAPSVHCARLDGGAVLALGLLGPITRALSGTYRCTATNIQGEAVKDVTLTVECELGVCMVHLCLVLRV